MKAFVARGVTLGLETSVELGSQMLIIMPVVHQNFMSGRSFEFYNNDTKIRKVE
jgi:hypothetical protein